MYATARHAKEARSKDERQPRTSPIAAHHTALLAGQRPRLFAQVLYNKPVQCCSD
jgi:hypothetical protein